MYLRITRARVDPARVDELAPVARDVGAALQRLPGFQGQHGGVDRGTGAVAAVSLWDTEEQARFSRVRPGDVIARAHAPGVRFEPPAVYEVLGRSREGHGLARTRPLPCGEPARPVGHRGSPRRNRPHDRAVR